MIADLANIHCEVISLRWHELAFCREEIYELGSRHIGGRAGIISLILAKAGLDGFYEFLLTCVSVSLHHVEYFMSVNHFFLVYKFKVEKFTIYILKYSTFLLVID